MVVCNMTTVHASAPFSVITHKQAEASTSMRHVHNQAEASASMGRGHS